MKRLLVANRGEIARRIIRTAHRMGVQTVAVFSAADAQALHVREATEAVGIGGVASTDSYLRIDRMLDAARAAGADAVHPGYGFLSENADFAQAVLDAGLTWVGPPPAAIRALGDKSAARRLARAHGVPVLPGYDGDGQDDERLLAEGARIGVPLMVKASAGGGGRGLRRVTDLAQLPQAIASARSEAIAAFGSGTLLLERALLAPRHVEVQVFADTRGGVIHLGERDCSVQRRNQKIVEETPSPAVDAALRERLGAAAVALARAAGYVGAGTVEFLLEDGAFYLMEMNVDLAKEKGPCLESANTRYGKGKFVWELRAEGVNELTDFTPSDDLPWEDLRGRMIKYGVRNATTGAIAPVESSSVVIESTNGINWVKQLIVVKDSKGGLLVQVVPEYRRLKKHYELMFDQPDCAPYIKTTAVLQVFTDQGISSDTPYSPKHFPEGKIPLTLVTRNLMLAHKWGVKSHYYHLVDKEGALAGVKAESDAEKADNTTPDDDYVCESCVL